MTDTNEVSRHIVTNRVRGNRLSHAVAEGYVREFPAVISDELLVRGREDRRANLLGIVLITLYA